jgi:hypothetical protein
MTILWAAIRERLPEVADEMDEAFGVSGVFRPRV